MRTLASRRLFPAWEDSALGRSYLMAYNGQDGDAHYAIGLAESWDGVHFQKVTPSSPLLSPYAGASWESAGVKDPCLLKIGPGDYRLWYAGINTVSTSNGFQIGLATSANGLSWTRSGSNPLLGPSVSGWDDGGIEFPSVFYEPSDVSRPFKMWYGGWASGSTATVQIGYAYSSDGVSWTKSSANPVLTVGTTGATDAVAVIPTGSVVKVGSTYNLFYAGRPNTNPSMSGDGVCLATFTNPEGTYTKSGSNPLLAPSTAEQALTSNLSAGGVTVNIASTAAFHAGEPCELVDSTGAQADVYVGTINSGTQMTLAAAASNTYSWTTANSASIRSLYYPSVDPRTILPTSTGYVMFLAPFQEFTGSPFSERAAAAVSSSLTSGWAYDYTRGFVLPLGAVWDTLSCENPSVIVE